MRNQVIFSTLANLIPVGFSWLILLYLIHFGTKESIGFWGLLQAIALPIHLFFTFKLRVIQLVDNDFYSQNTFFFTRFFLAILSLLFTWSYAFFFMDSKYLYPMFFLALSYSFAIIREYYISTYQLFNNNYYFFITSSISSFFSFLVFVITYYLKNDIYYSIIGFSIAKIFIFILDFYFHKDKNYINFKKININQILSLLKKGLPLGITVVMTVLMISIPQILIEEKFGLEELGVFVAITALLAMFGLFFNSIFQVFLPIISKLDNDIITKKIKKLLSLLVLSIFLLDLFCYTFFNFIYFVLLGTKDMLYKQEVIICIAAANMSILFSFGNFLLNLIRNFKIQPYIYGCIAIVVLLINLLLLRDFGLKLAIFSLLVANLVGFLLSFYFYKKERMHERNC